MSTSIDNRVVAMKFDNKQFESGVATSVSTLDKLKKSLNLEGAAKGLDGISNAAKNVNLSGLAGGVEAIGLKFSALQVMAVTALSNITNSAVNAGKNLMSSLTIDPIKQGFKEYETQMGAIQTVLANTSSKGTTLKDVNTALAELNTYSDKTIYNFTEMAKNIGTFTAAGVDLKVSTSAIKGIANLAAVSGSTSEQASTAMYQLSQAMASGTVKLMDWNSVVNAGMGGEIFQKSLMQTARVHGVNIDAMVKKEGSFRETLKTGWLTTSVLTETLGKFTGDVSKEQLKALGYSAKQIEEIIKMGKMASDAATKVKTFSQLLDTLKEAAGSGWAKTWQTLFGDFEEATIMFTNVSNVLGGIIGASADARNNMLSGWKDLGGRTVLIDAISIAFSNVMDVVKSVTSAFKEIFPPMTSQQLYNFTVGLKALMSGLTLSKGSLENLKLTFKGVFAILDIGVDILKFFAQAIGLIIKTIFPATGGLLVLSGGFGKVSIMIHDAIEATNIFGIALGALAKGLDFIKGAIQPGIDALKEWIKTSTLIEDVTDNITAAFAPYIAALKEWVKTSTLIEDITDRIKESFSKLLSTIKGFDFKETGSSSVALGGSLGVLADAGDRAKQVFSSFGSSLSKIGSVLKDVFGPSVSYVISKLKEISLVDVGIALGGGGLLIIAKGLKDLIGNFANITKGFNDVIAGITGSLEAFQTKLKADAMFKIAMAIGLLAISIIALSMIEPVALAKGLGALTVVFAELAGVIWLLQQATIASPGLSGKLIAIGISVVLLASALKNISEIDSGKLATGIQGLSALLTVLAIFIKVTSGATVQTSIISMFGIASAVILLSKAVSKFGEMKPEVLEQGIKGIVTSLMAMAIFIKAVGAPERMFSVGMGIAIIAASMIAFAGAVALFGAIPSENLAKGLIAMTTSLLAVAVALEIMPNEATVLASAVALNMMGVALYIIAGAVAIFGNMKPETLALGIGALAVALYIMAETAKAMTGTLSGAAAMVVMALAINMLVPAIAILGNMELTTIGIALLAMAGIFIVLGLAGLILTPLAPIIMTLCTSIALLGVGVYLLGGGLILFAAGLAALAAGGTVFIAAFVGVVIAILGLIPIIAEKLGIGLQAICTAVIEAMPKIMEAIKAVADGLIQLLGELTIPVVEAVLQLLLALLNKILEYEQPIIDVGVRLIVGFVNALGSKIDLIVSTAVNFIVAFVNALGSKIPLIVETAVNIIAKFLLAIAGQLGKVIDTAFKVIISFINGLADAIRNNHKAIYAACTNLINAIVDAIMGLIPSLVDVGVNIIKGVVTGIKSMAKALVDAAKGVISGAVDGIKNFLGIKSPSRLFAEIGRYSGQGLVNGLVSFGGKVENAATDLGRGAIDSMSNAIGGISDIVNGNIDSNPVIRPVMDLSNIQNGSKQLYKMMDGVGGYAINGSVNAAINAAKGIQSNSQTSNTPKNTQTTTPTSTQNTSVNNVFNIQGSNPKEIANEVSIILQKQVERRDTVWV
jgi:tape measure domain-containing protein